jgi:hypothetical protein
MNIERPTSNNVFCQFNLKTEQDYFARLAMKAKSEYTLRNLPRLPSTGSGPLHVEGSRSTLSFSTKSSRPKGLSQAAVRNF